MRRPDRTNVRSAMHLGLGLGVVGIAGYAFVSVVGHVFVVPQAAAELSALTAVYLLINIIGPGTFFPLEQETSRATSAGLARGEPIRTVAVRAGLLGAGLLGLLAAVLLVLWPVLLSRVLDGRVGLLAALILAGAGFALVYWARGVLSGQQRFRGYALTLYLEGAVRLAPCVVLFALNVSQPEAYGLAFAAGSGVAGLALLPLLRLGPASVPPERQPTMRRSLYLLVVAGLLTQLIANLGPVVVTYRMPYDLVTAAVFSVTFVLVRLPLFLFAPVQALLVPAFTRSVTTGRLDLLRRHLTIALGAAAAIAVPGAVLAVLLGPWAVRVLFNAAEEPAPAVLGLLGLSTFLMMVSLALQGALVALDQQRAVTLAWGLGALVFVPVLFAPVEPIVAALAAQVAGPAVVTVISGISLRQTLNRRRPVAAGIDHG